MGHHIIQILEIDHPLLCPVLALKVLLQSCPHPPTFPLFASEDFPHQPVIDTKFIDSLESVLTSPQIDPRDHRFHADRVQPSFLTVRFLTKT